MIMDNIPTSLYRELGVKPGVSPQQLRQAYRKSVMRYHPDTAKGGGNTEKFRQVTEAYKLLQEMTVEMHRSSKNKASRTYDLKQKFASVFKKKKRTNLQNTEKFSKNNETNESDTQKIKVNQQTSKLSLKELVNCVELSENEFVRQVALEAIALRKDENGINYLLNLLHKSDKSYRSHVIKALGMGASNSVNKHLLPFTMDDSIEITSSAIKALENINNANRIYIIEFLNKSPSIGQNIISRNLSNFKKNIFSLKSSKNLIGNILLRSGKINEEQLKIALLLQKRFPLLIGQIMRHLEYITISEIQNTIASQKISR